MHSEEKKKSYYIYRLKQKLIIYFEDVIIINYVWTSELNIFVIVISESNLCLINSHNYRKFWYYKHPVRIELPIQRKRKVGYMPIKSDSPSLILKNL